MRLSDFNRKWKSSVVDETFVGFDSNKLIDLDKKYSDLIKDDKFIGTDAQYKSYLKDVNSNKKINIKAEKDFKQYQKDFKDVQEGRSKGLDLSSGESIQDYLKDKPEGYDYSLKPTKLTTPPKDIIFIKPSEMEDFQNVRGYSDFAVTDFTKTTEGEGTGKQMESLSDFTDSLDQGSYAISLEGDTSKVKKIGVSKDTRVEYAPDGSVLYSGEASKVMEGMTPEELKTWKSKLKESAKFEGLDFSMKPYEEAYKKDGIYEGIKYAVTHPLIIKDLPVIKAGIPLVYKYFLESPVKGFFKTGMYGADLSMQTGDYLGGLIGGERKFKSPTGKGKFEEWINYDYGLSPLKDQDFQMAALTAGTIGLAGAGKVGASLLKPVGRLFQANMIGQAIKNPTEENLAMALLFVAPDVYAKRGKILQEISGKKPSKFAPTPEEIASILKSKSSRQRATLMIKDKNGKYLVSKKKGISAGGDIKAGETPRQAVLREVREELGLSKKDFKDIKFKEKIVTPEETYYTFEAVLRETRNPVKNKHIVFDLDNTLIKNNKLRPNAIELLESLKKNNNKISLWTHSKRDRVMRLFKKNNLEKYFEKIVTREDYAMGKDMNTFKDIKKIGGDMLIDNSKIQITKQRRAGNEAIRVSTYKGGKSKNLLKLKKELGGEKIEINPMSDMADGIKWVGKSKYQGVTGGTYRNPTMKKGVRVSELAIMNRLSGTKEPITWLGYESKYGKAYFGTQSRYDIPKKTAKEYAKMSEEMLIHATPDSPISMEFGKSLKIKPSKIKRGGEGLYVAPQISTTSIPNQVIKLEGYSGKGKQIKIKEIRDLPVKVGSEPPAGYVGLSYLDIGKPSGYKVTFNPLANFKRKALYVTKGKVGKDIKLTRKALTGYESEQVIKFGREIKKKGTGEYIWIGGKKVRIREMDILNKKIETELNNVLKNQKRKRTTRKIKTDEGFIEDVSPYKFVIPKEDKIKESKRDIPREILRDIPRERPKEIKKDIPREIMREIPRDIPRERPKEIPREKPKEIPRDIPRDILRDFPREIPRYIPRPPKEPIPIIPIIRKKPVKKQIKKSPSYDVYIKSKGKFKKVNTKPLNLVDSRNLRNYAVDNSLSRTGYLKPRTNKPSPLMYDINPNYAKNTANKFRQFKQKEGKRTKLQREKVIEYSKYALDSASEKKQLSVFKLLAKREKKRNTQNDFANPFSNNKKKRINKNKPIGLNFA
jgi:ADP-ribose pyrophosphatase YjhB (NUDIX family)